MEKSVKDMTKKERRAYYARFRTVWTRSPVTRRPKPPKAYDRAKERSRREKPDGDSFFRAGGGKTARFYGFFKSLRYNEDKRPGAELQEFTVRLTTRTKRCNIYA